jgi:hypothetical protein
MKPANDSPLQLLTFQSPREEREVLQPLLHLVNRHMVVEVLTAIVATVVLLLVVIVVIVVIVVLALSASSVTSS